MKKVKKYDYVKIIKPSFFERCGYEICLEDAIDLFSEKEKKDEIVSFLKKFITHSPKEKEIQKLTKQLASMYMANYVYKSNERKLYNFDYPKLKDKIFMVEHINYVRTGIYNNGYYPTPEEYYFGSAEQYSAYLTDIKSHKILTLNQGILRRGKFVPLKIESSNVEVVKSSVLNEFEKDPDDGIYYG